MWRAGFSGSEKQVTAVAKLGLNGAIMKMLAPAASPKMVGPAPNDNGNAIDPLNVWGHDTLWWLDRMLRSPNQLQERMTLNLHDHFATSNSSVGNVRHMLRQNRLLRRRAIGNFASLLLDITHDPAMLLWLNGADSNKWAPNENYAREVMELFCLGNDPSLEDSTYGLWRNSRVYKQTDIHEAARALTGWRYDWNKASGNTGKVADMENPTFYDPTYHDTGSKTIFGQKGNWAWQDVCRLVISHPNHAPFICQKLWSYFIPTQPSKSTLEMMINNYKASGHSLHQLLGVILRSPAMYQNLTAPNLVKPPIVFVAANMRHRNKFITDNNWAWLLDGMGQQPFYPPNVSGWNQNAAWLNTNSTRAYFRTTSYILHSTNGPADPGEQTPAQAVATAQAAVGNQFVSASSRAKLEAYATTFFARYKFLSSGKYVLSQDGRLERQQALRALIMCGPDGYLH
jgi:uncharacterized protein (DUF1800 family)